MPRTSQIKDRYGMTISTSSPLASQRWLEGADLLLSQNYGPEEKFQEALEADEGFALAHAGLAYMLMLQGQPEEAKKSAKSSVTPAKGITRREQQQIQA